MTKSWWHNKYKIFGKSQTPTEYLTENYNKLSDREIAEKLRYYCDVQVTKNAVKKKRQSLNLYKDNSGAKTNNDNAEFQEDGNYINIEKTFDAPFSLDDVIEMYSIDTSIWEVDTFKVNSWQVGAKTEKKDIQYNNGIISGKIKSDGLEVKTLYQTKASFARINPVAIIPVISPMRGENQYIDRKIRNASNEVQTSLVFADPHFGFTKNLRNAKLTPFHNRAVLDLILQISEYVNFDRIDILGDIFDFAEWSDKFLRSPEFYWTTQPAIIEAHWFLEQLRKRCPLTQISLHEGNHDRRLEMAIEKYLPAAYDLKPTSKIEYPPQLSVEILLDLDQLGIKYIDGYPDDYDVLGNSLELMHGKRALSPFRTVQEVAKSSQVSKVFGHIHRLEAASHTKWTGKEYQTVEAISPGCTCWIDGRVPGTSKRQQWQNGFMIINYTKSHYTYNLFPVKNNTTIINNALITGTDCIESLKKCYPGWNW